MSKRHKETTQTIEHAISIDFSSYTPTLPARQPQSRAFRSRYVFRTCSVPAPGFAPVFAQHLAKQPTAQAFK
jgi:hypothetical protein